MSSASVYHQGLRPSPVRASTADLSETLTGRTALIVSTCRSVGAAITTSLTRQGASIAVAYVRNRQAAQEILAEINALGITGSVHQGDSAIGADCRRVVSEVVEEYGSLDILINDIGVTVEKIGRDVPDWEQASPVNFRGVSCYSQAALAHMVERGTGRIINVSAIPVQGGATGQAAFNASLSELAGLTRSLAGEAAYMLRKSNKLNDNLIGITVNSVTAGLVNTTLIGSAPAHVGPVTGQVWPQRLAKPAEIARLVEFLAADASGYITGEMWGVNTE